MRPGFAGLPKVESTREQLAPFAAADAPGPAGGGYRSASAPGLGAAMVARRCGRELDINARLSDPGSTAESPEGIPEELDELSAPRSNHLPWLLGGMAVALLLLGVVLLRRRVP